MSSVAIDKRGTLWYTAGYTIGGCYGQTFRQEIQRLVEPRRATHRGAVATYIHYIPAIQVIAEGQ